MQRPIHMGTGLLEATDLQTTEDDTSLPSTGDQRLAVLLASVVNRVTATRQPGTSGVRRANIIWGATADRSLAATVTEHRV